jgi:FkbM family methyltransferase
MLNLIKNLLLIVLVVIVAFFGYHRYRSLKAQKQAIQKDIKEMKSDIKEMKSAVSMMMNMTYYPVTVLIKGKHFVFFDYAIDKNSTIEMVVNEMNSHPLDDYSDIDFKDGDVVVDIGAHVGIVSIYLAKTHPNIKIISVEPNMRTYEALLKNIQFNNVKNVIPVLAAICNDGEKVDIIAPYVLTGGGSIISKDKEEAIRYDVISNNIDCISLDTLIEKNGVKKIKLLKVDCEGCEFNALNNTFKHFSDIEYLRMEAHQAYVTKDEMDKFQALLKSKIKNVVIEVLVLNKGGFAEAKKVKHQP